MEHSELLRQLGWSEDLIAQMSVFEGASIDIEGGTVLVECDPMQGVATSEVYYDAKAAGTFSYI